MLTTAGLAAGVAACGGASTTGASAPSAATTGAGAPVDMAADRTTAQAINLTAADMPGWQESPNPPDATDNSVGAQISSCAGGPSPGKIDVVDATSPNFDKGQMEVSSDVQMVRSHADGLADLSAIKSPKLPSCLSRIKPSLTKQLPPGATLTTFSATRFTPSEHVPDIFGVHLTATVKVTENGITLTLPIHATEIGFLVGRAELTLTEAEQGQPASLPQEAALVNTLETRAQVHAAS